jgi:hypothetical protein
MLRFGLIAVVIVAGLYGLHRLCLKLEERGHLFYRHRKPSSGAARMFVPFQEMIDPPVKQVVQAEDPEMKRIKADDPTEDDGQPRRAAGWLKHSAPREVFRERADGGDAPAG